jgi:hypothetical protein
MKPRIEVKRNTLPQLTQKVQRLQRLPFPMQSWSKECVEEFEAGYRAHLVSQGRPGGQAPPLSSVTWHLYAQLGHPDGSGIRNHIKTAHEQTPTYAQSKVGVPPGRPTMIAKVQDEGASIQVSPKMRAWRARMGVPLKPTTQFINIPPRYSWRATVRNTNRFARRRAREIVRALHQ